MKGELMLNDITRKALKFKLLKQHQDVEINLDYYQYGLVTCYAICDDAPIIDKQQFICSRIVENILGIDYRYQQSKPQIKLLFSTDPDKYPW